MIEVKTVEECYREFKEAIYDGISDSEYSNHLEACEGYIDLFLKYFLDDWVRAVETVPMGSRQPEGDGRREETPQYAEAPVPVFLRDYRRGNIASVPEPLLLAARRPTPLVWKRAVQAAEYAFDTTAVLLYLASNLGSLVEHFGFLADNGYAPDSDTAFFLLSQLALMTSRSIWRFVRTEQLDDGACCVYMRVSCAGWEDDEFSEDDVRALYGEDCSVPKRKRWLCKCRGAGKAGAESCALGMGPGGGVVSGEDAIRGALKELCDSKLLSFDDRRGVYRASDA